VRPADLAAWLDWLERLHPTEVDLGLERVGRVARRMGLDALGARVITVAGTNGKGSVCAFLDAMLRADGRRVGLYTSPHLARFNERIRIDGREIGAAELVAAFERVESARGHTSLTFFEFGTLAALAAFARSGADVMVLEVGLGGRLDATNVVDADVAVVTSVALDHAEWLGDDLDGIAREKVGVARAGRPLVLGEAAPTAGLLRAAADSGARLVRAGADFDWTVGRAAWDYRSRDRALEGLPLPALEGGYQVRNAAAALAALESLRLVPPTTAIGAGLRDAQVPGRFEVFGGGVETILDVAHNPAAATVLRRTLEARARARRTHLVLGMYGDKDVAGVVAALAPAVDAWHVTALPPPRGADATRLAGVVLGQGGRVVSETADPGAAYAAALDDAAPGDRIVVAGSFATVGSVRARLCRSA